MASGNHQNSVQDDFARVLNTRGDVLWCRGDVIGAEKYFRLAIKASDSYALAHSNLGALLMGLHHYDEGFASIQKAAALNPNHAGILVNLGNALMLSGRTPQAVSTYQEAVRLDPADSIAAASLLRPLMDICDWGGLDKHFANIQERIASGKESDSSKLITPFNSLFLPLTRYEQRAIAENAAQKIARALPPPRYKPQVLQRNRSGRIRIGYLSSDFHDHATAHLTLGIYAQHDRNSLEVYAYSIGHPDSSMYRQKISSECDQFVDVHDRSTQQIAERIANDAIDILVDLKGYTGGGRTGILALRPAPVQVNYLGYPGTMGADFIDYLIADPIIIPESHADAYSEEIIRLPDSYQPTDDKQTISQAPIERSSAGLPEGVVVYCNFNAPAKIERRTFDCWMKVLAAVPNSVLWLMRASPDATKNLRMAAEAAGIDASRLLYAEPMQKQQHLARLQFADVILDCFICNAHTTATDALWAGVPVVTLTGETFASRVATSLLSAVGLSELATQNPTDYVSLAVELGTNRQRLGSLKSRLRNKAEKPLFSTARYVRNLDDAYREMFDRRLRAITLKCRAPNPKNEGK